MKHKSLHTIYDIRHTIFGISLLETLVVISIFGVLAILIARSVILTLGASKKSDSLINIRENLGFSAGVMERNLRNANSINCTADGSKVSYFDQYGYAGSFSCNNINGASGVGYVASGSATLSSSAVNITACTFTCDVNTSPPSITIELTGVDANATGIENSTATVKTQVFLRNY